MYRNVQSVVYSLAAWIRLCACGTGGAQFHELLSIICIVVIHACLTGEVIKGKVKPRECLWWSVAYMSGHTLNPAVVCYSLKKMHKCCDWRPLCYIIPVFPCTFALPFGNSFVLSHGLRNAALEQRCQVYKYNKGSGGEFERRRKRCNYNTLWHNFCILILFWGGSQAHLGCGCMCFQLLGLCAGTCSIYADLQSCLGVGICICVDLRSHSVYSWTKAHTWRFCCAVRTIIMAHFLPFLYD